ncbi:hypothetical protein BDZ89DRAFT_1112567 [Hymenopellis radicata]|nr:hypothetical protein BDZ89DRAFT_1112567 [Hymenopellis radicata]
MTSFDVTAAPKTVWREGDKDIAKPERPGTSIYRPDILKAIEKRIAELDNELRELSLDIHEHPEIMFEERHAHDVLTQFMERHGFTVERHYFLETAWKATFKHGKGGRTIGVNSEMDALKGVGHACGHNLIAIAGVAVSCAIKAVLEEFDIAGAVELLGTPAEEGGHGKVKLIDQGAYKNMAACLMCHPAPGPIGSVNLSSCLALQHVDAEYQGHAAHAALSPWEGINALDAAVLGYNNISALRQQLKPTHRVHGIFEPGKDWSVNVIPDYAKFLCLVRAPTRVEAQESMKRVKPCFEAAALATGCTAKINVYGATHDIRQNDALADEVATIVRSKYGGIDYEWGIKSASTDFGNVSYEVPSLHPGFAIPTTENGGNHTPGFTKSAATIEAHYACLDVSKALAATGVRVLLDDKFYEKVKRAFEKDKETRDIIS